MWGVGCGWSVTPARPVQVFTLLRYPEVLDCACGSRFRSAVKAAEYVIIIVIFSLAGAPTPSP